MSTVIANLLVRIGAETSGLDKGLGEVTSKVNKTASNLQSVGSTLTKYVTAPLAALGGLALKSSIDFESAFAGVRKTVDASEETFARLEQGIRDMAREIPASAGSIAQVAEAAGQLGIETENILSFTRVMIDLGEATNLSADEAATALARLANITGMPQESFDRLGSSIVALGNNLATTEAEIVQMSLRLAGAGAQIGLTEAEITGFAAALSSVGIEAEAGGSAFSRVMINMAQAARQGGDQLDLFASVAGVTAQQFREAFETDAAGAIQMFIEGLRRMSVEGGNTFGVLEDLGLSEIRVRDALLRTSGASDVLASSLQISRRAWEENTALTNEASQRYATTESVLRILWNRLVEVARTVGDALKPAFVSLLQSLEPVFQRVEQLAQAFAAADPATQKLIIGIGALAASIGPLLVTLASLAKSFVFVKEGLALLGAGFGPVGIAVTAFAALAVLLITNWESVVSFFRERFPTAFLAAQVALDTFKNAAESFADAVKMIFGGLIDAVEIVADGISKAFEGAFEGQAETTKKELDTLKGFWDEFGDDINEELDRDMKSAADTISTALTTIGRIVRLFMNPFISDWRSNLENLASIFTDIWDFIVRRLADYVDRFLHGLEAISTFFGGKWKTEIQNARKTVDEFAQGLQVGGVKIKRAGDEIGAGMERAASSTREFDVKAFDTGNSISALEERFGKLAQAAQDTTPPVKAVSDSTADAGDAADKAADKWEVYAKAMKEAEARHRALGGDLDFVKAQISATETLLVEMAKSGDTSSEAFVRLQDELKLAYALMAQMEKGAQGLGVALEGLSKIDVFKSIREFKAKDIKVSGIRELGAQIHEEMEGLARDVEVDTQTFFGRLYGAFANASWGTIFEPVVGAFESFSNIISGKGSFADNFSSILNFGTDLARSFKSGAVDIGQSLHDIAEGVISQFGPYGRVAGAVLGFMDELGLGLDDIGSRLGRLLGIGQGGKHSNPDIAAAREMIESLRNQGVALEEIIEIVARQFDTLSRADIEGLATGINTAFINLRDWAGEWDDNQREKMDVFNSVVAMLQQGLSEGAIRGLVGTSPAFADEVRKFGLERVTRWVDEILAKVEQFGVTFDPQITIEPPDTEPVTEEIGRTVDEIFSGIGTALANVDIGGTLEEQYDALNAKADILRQGIADLIAAGVDPASAQFRNLTINLQSTERQIENIAKQMKIESIFGDMAASMEDIKHKALVMGDSFDSAGAKVSLLENTMIELLKAGVDPASADFRMLGTELDLARAEAERFANEMRVQDIWDRLGDSLEDVRAKAQVLGDEFNHFEAEARIMEQALIDLAREGKYATPEFLDLSRSLDETRRNAAKLDEQMRRQDAWERLQRDLKQIDAQAFVLGDTFNATEAKARVVERAMIDLIANGIDPSSSAYRILEEALRTGNFSADLFTDTIRKQTDAYSELNYVASQVPGWIRAQNEAMQETYNRNIAPVPKALSELEAEYKALLDKAAGIRARLDDPSTSPQSARNLRINLQSVERLIESTFKRLEEARKAAAATTTKPSTTSTSTPTPTSQPRTTTSYSSGIGSSVSLDTRNIEKGLDEIRRGIDEMSSLMVSAAGELIRVIESGAKPSDGGGRSWQEIVDTIIGLAGRTAEVAAAGAASQVASTSALQQTVDSIVREQSAMSGQLEALLRALDSGRISSIQLRELSKLLSDDREVSKMLAQASVLKGQEQRQIVQHINIVLDKRRLAETTLQGFPEVIYAHGGGR